MTVDHNLSREQLESIIIHWATRSPETLAKALGKQYRYDLLEYFPESELIEFISERPGVNDLIKQIQEKCAKNSKWLMAEKGFQSVDHVI